MAYVHARQRLLVLDKERKKVESQLQGKRWTPRGNFWDDIRTVRRRNWRNNIRAFELEMARTFEAAK